MQMNKALSFKTECFFSFNQLMTRCGVESALLPKALNNSSSAETTLKSSLNIFLSELKAERNGSQSCRLTRPQDDALQSLILL
jgi:hypothetical protein